MMRKKNEFSLFYSTKATRGGQKRYTFCTSITDCIQSEGDTDKLFARNFQIIHKFSVQFEGSFSALFVGCNA